MAQAPGAGVRLAGGIRFRGPDEAGTRRAADEFAAYMATLDLARCVTAEAEPDGGADAIAFRLGADFARAWTPDHDTLDIRGRRHADPCGGLGDCDLEREIVIALAAGPIPFEFPNCDEAVASIHIRRNIVEAAARTALAFHTTEAERPSDFWVYDEARGFTVRPGKSLIDALGKTTQPGLSGMLYSFSCYRATEYVIMLAIAQELHARNRPLLARLQRQCEKRVIRSGQFHDVFLVEYGSMESPLPPRYYVPGDRLWFRNPDERSSDVTGYEGSWVFYLGDGLFSNFWKCGQPYTMTSKCLEIFCWRYGAYRDAGGELQMDESLVDDRVRALADDPAKAADILSQMMRLRDAKGIYGSGGCIDTSREYPRRICPGTEDLLLPEV